MLGWVAVYTTPEGLRLYSSAETDFADLPGDGWLDGAYWWDDGGVVRRETLGGYDFVALVPHATGERFFAAGYFREYGGRDIHELLASVRRRYPGADIKRGRWTSKAEMREASRMVLGAACP